MWAVVVMETQLEWTSYQHQHQHLVWANGCSVGLSEVIYVLCSSRSDGCCITVRLIFSRHSLSFTHTHTVSGLSVVVCNGLLVFFCFTEAPPVWHRPRPHPWCHSRSFTFDKGSDDITDGGKSVRLHTNPHLLLLDRQTLKLTY